MDTVAAASSSWEESSSDSTNGSSSSGDDSPSDGENDCPIDVTETTSESNPLQLLPVPNHENFDGVTEADQVLAWDEHQEGAEEDDESKQIESKQFWESNPEIYGIRRSSRTRKEPERLILKKSDSDSDSDNEEQIQRRRKARKQSSSQWIPNLSSDSDNSESSRDVPRGRHLVGRRRPSIKTSKASHDSSHGLLNDSRFPRERQSSGRVTVQVSYKEQSDGSTDSEDLLDVANDAQPEVVAEDVEVIEKILNHRLGRPGCTGAVTTCYAPEYEKLCELGEPDPQQEATELQFLIKWKNWAYIHSTYETEATLQQQQVKGMKKLANYLKRKEEIENWKANAAPEDVEYFECQQQLHIEIYNEYTIVERIIAHEYSPDAASSYPDYLCKWQGLPYSECTWEDGSLIARYHQEVIDQYLNRESSSKIPNRNSKVLKQKPRFVPAKTQPQYVGADRSLQLRDYQLDGINWIAHSWCRGNSGILADEMGLGKTIQSITFLLYLFQEHSLYGPFLVVVPLSTMAAWQKEFQTWAPDINVVVYIGDVNSRSKIQEFEWCHKNRKLKFNAILTTYEMLLRDKDLLGSIYWAVLMVDEAHRLKNDDSLLYRSLVDFKTNFRLLITGTPLQNSLKELWSLLHFIMPDRFSSWEQFEAQYPLTEMKEWYLKLHKELEPYLLRRVKKDVEKSLPAKVEQILRVEMSSVQKQYYKWILTKNYKSLMKGVKGNTSGFLNIVVELKKCCNHASLTRPLEEVEGISHLQSIIRGSGKTILLDKLLCRLKERGHRVLIFSQMVRMLDILAEYCTLKHFQFQRLDGGIRGDVRKQALDRFNAEGSTDFCFLLSTRAGGLGINLATADTVIIFDSDWNPQNDLQAMARAHRIGQQKQVNIYRLVTRGTIEEDIIERAKKKMVLDHLIIQRMDTTGRKVLCKSSSTPSSSTPFNKEELAAILKFGAEELFKENDEEQEKKLQEMSIDDILEMAETHDSDAHPSTVGDELLSQFKVANLGSFKEDLKEDDPTSPSEQGKSWEEIIPEPERQQMALEEEQRRQLDMFLPPRQRKSTTKVDEKATGNKGRHRPNKKESDSSSDSSAPANGEEKPRRKRGRPRTSKRDEIDGFNDSEIRRFIKSYKKFARPKTRLDSIAANAELLEKSVADLKRLADLLHEGCLKAVKEYHEKLQQDPQFDGKKRGATMKLSSVTVNAPTILKYEEELEPLAKLIPDNQHDQLKFRIAVPTRNVHWGKPWDVADDSMLLVGLHRHGFGNWESIKADSSLGLASKILVPGVSKPTEKHLQSRAEYLTKLLRQQCLVHTKGSADANKTSKPKAKKKHVPLDEKPPSYSSPIVERPSTGDGEASASVVVKRETTVVDNGVKDSKRKKTKEEKKDKFATKTISTAKVTDGVSYAHSAATITPAEQKESIHGDVREVSDMDRETFTLCKERMRPVKKALRQLETPDDKVSDRDQVINTRQCLLKIGSHIEKHLEQYRSLNEMSQWRSNLWTFVSKFTAYDASKLYNLYRIAVKRKDEMREEKRPLPKPSQPPKANKRSRVELEERGLVKSRKEHYDDHTHSHKPSSQDKESTRHHHPANTTSRSSWQPRSHGKTEQQDHGPSAKTAKVVSDSTNHSHTHHDHGDSTTSQRRRHPEERRHGKSSHGHHHDDHHRRQSSSHHSSHSSSASTRIKSDLDNRHVKPARRSSPDRD